MGREALAIDFTIGLLLITSLGPIYTYKQCHSIEVSLKFHIIISNAMDEFIDKSSFNFHFFCKIAKATL